MNIVKQRGFTIIEVVLVLAIASLIFLMVFLALPALQAGQRDTDRKSDASKVLAALTTYQSNNNGANPDITSGVTLPSTTDKFASYLNTLSTNSKKLIISSTATEATPVSGDVLLYTSMKCGTSASIGKYTVVAGTDKQAAVVVKLESGGGAAYCLNS